MPDARAYSATGVSKRSRTGAQSQIRGIGAESRVCRVLDQRGWRILLRRARTGRGEIDIVAEHAADNLIAFIEVKSRASCGEAAAALSAIQRARILGAAEILLGQHPEWSGRTLRFDLFLLDQAGGMRRINDAFRVGD